MLQHGMLHHSAENVRYIETLAPHYARRITVHLRTSSISTLYPGMSIQCVDPSVSLKIQDAFYRFKLPYKIVQRVEQVLNLLSLSIVSGWFGP